MVTKKSARAIDLKVAAMVPPLMVAAERAGVRIRQILPDQVVVQDTWPHSISVEVAADGYTVYLRERRGGELARRARKLGTWKRPETAVFHVGVWCLEPRRP